MEIVIEYSLLISTFVHFFVIKLSSLFLKQVGRFAFLVSLFGGAISLIYPLFALSFLLKLLLCVFSLCLVCLICFGYKKLTSFLRNLGVLLLSTFVFGGACEGIRNLIGTFPLFVVCLVVLAVYLLIKVIFKSLDRANKVRSFTYLLKIIDGGKEVIEEGYLDSGNVLLDGITKKPIILINFDVFHRLYENISYISALTKTYDFKKIKNGHYQKISSIGGGGNLLVFSVDEVQIGEDKSFKDVMLGLSFSGFEKSFGKKVLLNCELM